MTRASRVQHTERDQWIPLAPIRLESSIATGTLPKNIERIPISIGAVVCPQPRTTPLRIPKKPIIM